MATKPISAEIYTASHRILGRISPGSGGLFSFLNIPTTSYIEIEGAHVTRLHQPGRMVARYPEMWLVKQDVVALLVSSRVELGTVGAARGGYTSNVATAVHILLGGYELHGTIETPGKLVFGSLMFEGSIRFLALYNAELTAILFPNIRAQSAALLFNRDHVNGMAVIPKDASPPPPAG
jgi:hypothetical protein